MTDRLIRIKASRDSYRRGGLSLGPKWLEVDTSSLSPKQSRAILADSLLTIEGHEDDDTWSPMSSEIRAGLVMVLDGVVEGDGTGSVLPPASKLDLIDTLADAIEDVATELDALGLGRAEPESVLPSLIDLIVDERKQADAALKAAGSDFLDTIVQANADVLTDLGVSVKAEDRMAVIPQLIDLISELKAKPNTPASEEPGGGGGDPAAPSQGKDAKAVTSPDPAGGKDGASDQDSRSPTAVPMGGKSAKSKAD